MAVDILNAIKYMHSRDFIHCDLKSENILVDNSCNYKFCDFGLSFSTDRAFFDRNRVLLGTPGFTAPEILQRKGPQASDIWIIGVIIYELITGGLPYNSLEGESFRFAPITY